MSESKVQSEEIFDSYLAMRFSKKKFKMRIGTGPLQPDEKRKIFEAPDVIDMENAILLDLDYYVSEYGYKDLHLEKLVSEAYKESLGIVQTFHEKLE